jgi:hypothetical protein
MAQALAFYIQQAENCAQAAFEAALTNKRDKFLRPQAAWQALADKTAFLQAEAIAGSLRRRVEASQAEMRLAKGFGRRKACGSV